jgi:hypothetical protein
VGGVNTIEGPKPGHAFGGGVSRQAAMADFAPGVEQVKIARLGEAVILPDQAAMITSFVPEFEGVSGIGRHQGFVAAAAVSVRELGGPEGNAGRYAQGMRGDSMLKKDAVVGQPFQGRGFTEGVPIKMTGCRLLLVGHDHKNIGLIRHDGCLSTQAGLFAPR